MPTDITQSNDRVAEVHLICDLCGKLIGISLIPKKQADAGKNVQVICQNCREEKHQK